ncbi:hypothetical protein [[Phormidium] sp. ETS-05]|uniref:hypothetical protein n=1 Tax=[Phormidium] sp. ETS-05 TaxID=222819 RepID=UPI0018EEF226|nr:hypothetical protein [[Phormidium] sp. ETS-05]
MSNDDNSSQHSHHHNPFDSLMQSLGLDSHQQPTPDQTHHNFNPPHDPHSQPGSGHDWHQSGWQSGHSDLNSGLASISPDATSYHSPETSSTFNFDQFNAEFNAGWSDNVAPHHHQSHDVDQFSQPSHQEWHHSSPHQDYSSGYHHHSLGGMEHQPQHLMSTDNYHISKDDKHSVDIWSNGSVYWHSGGQAGHIDGNKFYNSHEYYLGKLGADMKVYNAHNECVGWVDAHGRAYTTNGVLFAEGGTTRWAAAVLVYNTCSPDS